ncbi:MAG: hypothetical protein IPH45_17935 [Bacteroidales bacterium]|nr:hypothetical protein [Bacteroidales bacterium]
MEISLSRAFLNDGDSTGNAHLKEDNSEFIDSMYKNVKLKQFNDKTYCFISCGADLVDPRDGQVYKTTCIGDQVWMAENLNYNASGSVFYNNGSANGPLYGRLYDWETVMNGSTSSSLVPSGVQGICHMAGIAQ